MPPDFLRKFDLKRHELSVLRDRITVMEAELCGWEEAARAIDPDYDERFGQVSGNGLAAPHSAMPRADNAPRIRRSWQALLKETAKHYPADVSLDDMERMSEELGDPTTRNTLRSQMSIYTSQQIVERTRQGHYRLTRTGADALGIQLPVAQANVKPSPAWTAPNPLDASGPVSDKTHDNKEDKG